MKQLRPSQIDREQLIREVEINRRQCGASHTQTVTDERETDKSVGGFARPENSQDTLNNLEYGEKHRGSCFTPVILELKDYTGPLGLDPVLITQYVMRLALRFNFCV